MPMKLKSQKKKNFNQAAKLYTTTISTMTTATTTPAKTIKEKRKQ